MSPSGVKEAPLEQTDGGFVAGGEGWFILNARDAPWFVIPANHKWFRDLAISQIIVETMEKFGQPTRVLSAISVYNVCEPFIRRRLSRYFSARAIAASASGAMMAYPFAFGCRSSSLSSARSSPDSSVMAEK